MLDILPVDSSHCQTLFFFSLVVDGSNATVLTFIWPYQLCSISNRGSSVLSVRERVHALYVKEGMCVCVCSLVAACLNVLSVSQGMKI